MNHKVWKVQERVSAFAKYYFGEEISKMAKNTGIEEFTTFPLSYKVVRAKKDYNGAYLTGLTEKEEEYYGKIMGKDLGKHSSFWREELSACTLSGKTSGITFNEGLILDVILMKMAIASGYLAPNKTALLENPLYQNTNFYLLDETEEKTRLQKKNQLEDDCISILAQSRNNKDKLLMYCFSLNISANESYAIEDIYNDIKKYIRSIENNLEKLEHLKKVLETDATRLQANYYFHKSIGKTISLDNHADSYMFEGTMLGASREKAVEFLLLPENKSTLAKIIKVYKERIKK